MFFYNFSHNYYVRNTNKPSCIQHKYEIYLSVQQGSTHSSGKLETLIQYNRAFTTKKLYLLNIVYQSN